MSGKKAFNAINDEIVRLLGTVNKLAEVKNNPISNFQAYPAAYVMPSENEGDFETNMENDRAYAFYVRIFYEVDLNEPNKAWEAMRDIADDILDLFDQNFSLSNMQLTDSRYSVPRLNVAPSVWLYLQNENLLMAEFRIVVRISVDISS